MGFAWKCRALQQIQFYLQNFRGAEKDLTHASRSIRTMGTRRLPFRVKAFRRAQADAASRIRSLRAGSSPADLNKLVNENSRARPAAGLISGRHPLAARGARAPSATPGPPEQTLPESSTPTARSIRNSPSISSPASTVLSERAPGHGSILEVPRATLQNASSPCRRNSAAQERIADGAFRFQTRPAISFYVQRPPSIENHDVIPFAESHQHAISVIFSLEIDADATRFVTEEIRPTQMTATHHSKRWSVQDPVVIRKELYIPSYRNSARR